MTRLLEIPICAADGTPTGEVARFEAPPPEVWQLEPGSMLELRRFRELTRFGCGCIWEERLAYVPRKSGSTETRVGIRPT